MLGHRDRPLFHTKGVIYVITVERPDQLAVMIYEKNMELLGHARREEVELYVGIAATESGFTQRIQMDAGPARGLFQVEPDTAYDVCLNYLRPKRERLRRIMLLSFGIYVDFFPDRICLPDLLEIYDDFSFLIARCVLLRRPEPIPVKVEEQAEYYKQWYNTQAGKGSKEKYLADWKAHGCQALIEDMFPSG